MKVEHDPIDELSRALDQTGAIISRVRPDQATLPTPCTSWDVRALVQHVVQDVRHFTVTASGGMWNRSDAEDIGDDWTGTYREAADSLIATWRREGVVGRMVKLPFGTVPADWCVSQEIADFVVHGWDVAKATGQSTDLDPELGQMALDWARQNLGPQFRRNEESGSSFGPEVPVPETAPIYDRLAAFFGRNPD